MLVIVGIQVIVTGLGAVFMANKLTASIDRAQTIAAQHSLRELGVHVDGMIHIV